ncbi:MAG: glycosyltransferase family 2 protein [Candidatus Omnitrophica bacterium]|nr:glycosyltransferase family 2 protein [Candidatus Omnitrophota bacterium]
MFLDKQNLVSVVIPAYNRAYTLRRAINSVLNQTHQNVEIFVVDDGSTDNTQEIVRNFLDPRVRYIRHPQNLGISAARNTGIEVARGNFVALLDSDDEFLSDKIEKSLKIFDRASRRVGLVSSNHYLQSADGRSVVAINEKKLKRVWPMPSTWVLRRDVFKKIGLFDLRIRASEDTDFFARVREKYSFHFIKEPLVIKYVTPDNFFVDKEKIIQLRRETVFNVRQDRRLYARQLLLLGKDLWGAGRKDEARQCYLKAFFAYPVNLGYFIKFFLSSLKKF